MKAKKIAPVHPGEILMEEFLKPLGISQYRLAKISMCRLLGLMKLYTASERLRLIRR